MAESRESSSEEELIVPPLQEKKEEITQEYIDTLREVIRSVSGDAKIGFELGNTGEGSRAMLFSAEHREIILDPEHVKDRDEGVFVAAHEAAHVFMSIGPKEMGLSPEKTHELFNQIGLGFTNNALEDCAISKFQISKFLYLEPLIKKNYDKEFATENAALYACMPGSPEEFLVKDFYFKNGYMPRFIQYGSEVMRDWHQQRFSLTLDESVEKALKKTIKDARKSITEVPGPQENSRKKIVTIAQKRFKINVEKVWPEVKKLVEMDLHTEELRQMLNELMNAVRELMEKEYEKQQAQQQGDEQKEKEAEEGVQQAQKNMEDLGGDLSEDAKKELLEIAKEVAKKMMENQKPPAGQKEGSKVDQEGSQQESGQPSDAEQSQESGGEPSSGSGEGDSGEHGIEKEKNGPSKPVDLPFNESMTSEKTKKEIEEKFKKLSEKKKKELREKAQQEMKDFEDKINAEKEGKLTDDKPKSHSEIDEEKEAKKQEKENKDSKKKEDERKQKEEEEEQKRREKIENDLRAKMREGMPRYQKIMEQIEQPRDELYERLRHILRPEEYSGLESGHPSGKILNVGRAMQSERDADQLRKMWDREYEPVESDNRIVSLIDLSGSMEERGKINEAESGVDMAVSALDKLEDINPGIKNAVIGYHRRTFHYKKMNQRLDEKIQKDLSTMPDRTLDNDAGTDTYLGIQESLKEINENLGATGNFILNFTDGESSNADKLQKLLTEGKEERKAKKIKVGLIWVGEGLNDAQLDHMMKEYGYDFGLVMPATKLTDKDIQIGKKDFATALADLLEDIVKNPDKY